MSTSALIVAGLVILILLVAGATSTLGRIGSILSDILTALHERRDAESDRESFDPSGIEFTLDSIDQRLRKIEELLGNVDTIERRLENLGELLGNVNKLAGRRLVEREIRWEILTYLTKQEGHQATVATITEDIGRERDDVDSVLLEMAEAREVTFSAKRRSVSLTPTRVEEATETKPNAVLSDTQP